MTDLELAKQDAEFLRKELESERLLLRAIIAGHGGTIRVNEIDLLAFSPNDNTQVCSWHDIANRCHVLTLNPNPFKRKI